MHERLRYLYGEAQGETAFADLERILDAFPAPPATRPPSERFSQADALLITYGDTFLPGPADEGLGDRGLPLSRCRGHSDAGRPEGMSAEPIFAPRSGGPVFVDAEGPRIRVGMERGMGGEGIATPLAALRAFAERHLDGLLSGIHILPCFPYSSDYGFSVIDYEQIDPELGTWADVQSLGQRFNLMLDYVANHCSAEGAWFQAFLHGEPPYDQYFIRTAPHADLRGVTRPRTTPLLTPVQTASGTAHVWTTFSADQVDLNYANPAVLLRMLRVMLTYVQHGATLLRMDAIGYLWKEIGTRCIHLPQTHQIVKLFRDVLDEVAPDVAIVTETNVPHADNISYFGDGHDEAQMVYQFPLAPLVLHTLATGDATRLSEWVATLETPSDSTTFFNFLASHDGIGVVPARGILTDAEVEALAARVRAHGGEVSYKTNPDGSESPYELNGTLFDILSDPNDTSEPWEIKRDRFLCSQAIMLALAGVPGIYVHSLFGSHNDYAAYARSGWKRDLNHERLPLPEIEGRLADPASEAARVFEGYRRLLAIRRERPAFHPQSPQTVLDIQPGIFAIRRGPRDGEQIVAIHNVTAAPIELVTDRLVRRYSDSGPVKELLSGKQLNSHESLVLPPYGVAWVTDQGWEE